MARLSVRSRSALVPLSLAFLGALAACRESAQHDADVPLIPIEPLLARPNVTAVQVSPDGKTLAVIERVGSTAAIILRDLAGVRIRTAFTDTVRAVSNVRWSSDSRWLLILHDRGGDEGYHLLRVDARGTQDGGQDGVVD